MNKSRKNLVKRILQIGIKILLTILSIYIYRLSQDMASILFLSLDRNALYYQVMSGITLTIILGILIIGVPLMAIKGISKLWSTWYD